MYNCSCPYSKQLLISLCQSCVWHYALLHSMLGFLNDFAQVDVELARSIANIPLKNKDLQKRLWLKIAEHVIKKENNIEKYIFFIV